jgi:type II secretion system protein N
MKRVLRVAGFAGWFLGCFLLFSIVTFPMDGLRPLLITQAEKALGKGQQGAYGVDPVVQVGSLSSRFVGVQAKRVHLQLASKEPEPGPTFDLDKVTIKVSALSLLFGDPKVSVSAKLYGGDLDATVRVNDKQELTSLDVDIDGIDIGGIPAVVGAVGAAVSGKLDLRAVVDMGKLPDKDASGHMKLALKGLSLGPGKLSLVPGGFEMEEAIQMGNLAGKMTIKEGVGTIESLKFEGTPDIEAEVAGTLAIRPKLELSRLDIDGFFRPTAPFLQKNTKIQSALEIGEKLTLPGAPSLTKAKDTEGRYYFGVKGSMKTLSPQLARDNGKRAKARFAAPAAAGAPSDG